MDDLVRTRDPETTTREPVVLWRARVQLPDRPGALAGLARACAERGVNILSLEVLPDVGSVTDELVLAVPAGWDLATLVALLEGADARPLLVGRAPVSALADQTVRHLRGVARLVDAPQALPEVLADLLDARPDPGGEGSPRRADRHRLVLSVPGGTMVLVRDAPFTPTEQARADVVIELAERLTDVVTPPEPGAAASGEPESSSAVLRRHDGAVVAEVDGRRIGEGKLITVGVRWGVRVFVHPAWRRRGLGSALLREVVEIALERGLRELEVRLDAQDLGGLRLVLASGLCGSVSCDGEETRTRLILPVRAVAG